MKIIDLLNKISNGEIPIKIKYKNEIYIYQEDEQDYAYIEDGYYNWLLSDGTDMSFLNEEVELIEDEVDIDNIEEMTGTIYIRCNNKNIEAEDYFYNTTNIAESIKNISDKQNELVKAVKQLNKEIKSIREK